RQCGGGVQEGRLPAPRGGGGRDRGVGAGGPGGCGGACDAAGDPQVLRTGKALVGAPGRSQEQEALMRLRILAVGTRMPGWVTEGFNEYRKRLPPEIRVELVELPLGPRGKGQPLERAMEREGEAMLKAIQPGDGVIALDVPGKPWSTEQLARQLRAWQESGKNHNLLIGGPDGLPPACLARA